MNGLRVIPVLILVWMLSSPSPLEAATREELDARIHAALEEFYATVPVSRTLAERSAGMLVFPRVIKAGFVVGGEVGEGALLVQGQAVQYYRTTGLSVGLQAGIEGKTQVVLFMTREALDGFRSSNGWRAGVDGGVAVLAWGGARELDTDNLREPIMAFVFDNKGLMADVSLEGARYWKIDL